VSGGDPNVVVRAILAQPAYRQAGGDDSGGASIASFVAWIEALLRRLFAGLHVTPGALGFEVAGLVVFVVAAGAAAVIVYRIVARAARRSVPQAARAGGVANPEPARELLARARAAADRGEYAEAIVLTFRAALASLDERALVAYDRTRTPGEYRRAVERAVAAAAGPFDELTAGFVRASFGHGAALRADFDAAQQAYAAFEPLALAA
jgi:hypothetical protein